MRYLKLYETFLIGQNNDPPQHILDIIRDRMVDFTDKDYFVQVDYTKIDTHLYITILSYDPNNPGHHNLVEIEHAGDIAEAEVLMGQQRLVHPNIIFDDSLIDSLIVTTMELIDNGFELMSYSNHYIGSGKNPEELKRLKDFNNSKFVIMFKDVEKFNKRKIERENRMFPK